MSERSMVQAYIGIGSNLNDPVAQVRRALQALATLPASRCVAYSALYRSAALGGPVGQPDYINAVAALQTELPAPALLTALQAIEQAQGRVRDARWGPRTLDLDLLVYGQEIRREPPLTLPHPRLQERAFVLYPLQEIAPELYIPGLGEVKDLVQRCPPLRLERLGAQDS